MRNHANEADLIDLISGEISVERRTRLDEHLRHCAECRAMLRDMDSLIAGLQLLAGVSPTNQVALKTSAERTGAGGVSRSRVWLATAAVAAVAGAGALLWQRAPHGPEASAIAVSGPAAHPVVQLRELDSTAADAEAVAKRARRSSSVPVRLAAWTAGTTSVATPASDLVSAFSGETDLNVRLWLVVEIARSGDAVAARSVYDRVLLDPDAPDELRDAVRDYLERILQKEIV